MHYYCTSTKILKGAHNRQSGKYVFFLEITKKLQNEVFEIPRVCVCPL